MPECENCGGFMTEQYAWVFAPSEMDTVYLSELSRSAP